MFYLGTHKPFFLGRTRVPLFVSRRALAERRTFPRARGPWALDSGGFSELTLYGAWRTPPAQYVEEVRRFRDEIGRLQWAAIQDWMCEPFMLRQTGLTLAEHQRRTVNSYAELLERAPELPWRPVLQGYHLGDYLTHAEAYARSGLPLADRVVGLGSVCRRQATTEAAEIAAGIRRQTGFDLHGFGVKTTGLPALAPALASADSMAWSYRARRGGRHPACTHPKCNNCLRFALLWRAHVLRAIR